MAFIDTHAHIFSSQFKSDLSQVIQRASEVNVEMIFMPNIDSGSIDKMIRVEEQFPEICRSMIGLHPCSVKEDFEKELKIIEKMLDKRKFAGIGETGTDLYWDKSFYVQQEASLKIHIDWAKEYSLPIILHSRNSLQNTLSIIEENMDDRLSGIFHCFTGSVEEARRIIDLGFYLGIGGVVTFKNSNLHKVLEKVPLSSILLETDSPYLAPDPHRGKRNEPGYLQLIASKLADIYQVDVSEIARITTANGKKVFKVW